MATDHREALVNEASKLHINDTRDINNSHRHLETSITTKWITSTRSKAQDITNKFTQAAEALGTGQLIKDDFFTLFEAVGALEIMDPKMDSGYLAEGEELEEDYDVLRELLPGEVVGIMDQLLRAEVAYYMGHHLPQTLFSSIYIDALLWPEPGMLEQACFKRDGASPQDKPMLNVILRTYCLALLKICDCIHRTIVAETFYEEEDFVSNLYNRKLLSEFDTGAIESLLDEAIALIENYSDILADHLREAIICRLKFRKAFLDAATLAGKSLKPEHLDLWKLGLKYLPDLLRSNGSGTEVPMCFSAKKIQRRLASTVPPRPLIQICFKDAHDFLKRLFEDAINVGGILECDRGSQINTFLLTFQSRKPQPSVYVRCLLEFLIHEHMQFPVIMSFTSFIYDDLAEIVLPAHLTVDIANYEIEAPQDPRFQIARKMEKFITNAGLAYLNMIRALNMNRSRMRRMLCKSVHEWENMQFEAEDLDVELRELTQEKPLRARHGFGTEDEWSFPLSSWAYYHKLCQMEWIVQIGFELQIYRKHELAGMYWYLHLLASTRLNHLRRIGKHITKRKNMLTNPEAWQTTAFNRSISFLNVAMLHASATTSLADALSCLYIALTHLGLIQTQSFPYSTPQFRYFLRMRPFLPISTPAVPTYEEFTANVCPLSHDVSGAPPRINGSSSDRLNALLNSAELATKIARKEWEAISRSSVETARCHGCEPGWRAGQKDVQRSVIALSIALAAVKKWVTEGRSEGGLSVEMVAKGYHDCHTPLNLFSTLLEARAATGQPTPTGKIPSSSSSRPAHIPLRTLIPPPRFSDEHSASLLESTDEKQRFRRSTDTLGSDYSFFGDTGDLAEQLADEEDPLRIQLRSSFELGALGASRSRRRSGQHSVHYVQQDHLHRKSNNPGVDKEAIQIPAPARRYISRPEKIIAVIMTGDRQSSQMRGLTGKPLLYFTSVFVSLGVFLFGYDQGVMSGIITGAYFKGYFNHPSKAEIGTMVAILEVGAFIASLSVGRIGDMIGRRRTILYGSIIFFVGGSLQTLATGMPMMLVGRFIAGLGVGALSTIVPVYQSEISPPHNRGKLACIEFTGNVCGYAASVWVDYFCSFILNDYAWRVPLALQCFMGALLGLGSLIICESPRWLLDNDHDEEGIVVIANLYGGGDIHNDKARQEYREIKMDVLLQRQEGERSYRDMFRKYTKRVFIAMSAQALAQLNGINVISYYAPLVFEQAGWTGRSAILMTGINGITYLISTIPPWYLVDRWGRRPILLSGAVAMIISLSLISYFLYLDIRATMTLVVIFVMIYNASFGASWGPIPWLYPPEILPLSIRAKGASMSTATNWAFNWLVGELTPILLVLLGWRLYLLHAFFCAVSFVLVYFIYPETANLRLEDMDQLFGDATTAMPTPAQHAEVESLMSASRSPVPSIDIRRGRPGNFTADNAIPGLDINPPSDAENGKLHSNGKAAEPRSEGIGGWISRMVNRSKSYDKGVVGQAYRRLDQDDD